MEHNTNGTQSLEDVEYIKKAEADIAQVQKWLEADLGRIAALIAALQHDKDLRFYLATWFHGRIANERNKKAAEQAKNQMDMFPKS